MDKIKMSNNNKRRSALFGAAFLMATSAIGPGFLMQTTFFTDEHRANLGFSILVTTIFLFVVQLNVWRVIGVSGMREQDIANRIFPKLGYLIACLVSLGGYAFNISNVGGTALGLGILIDQNSSLLIPISGGAAAVLFLSKSAAHFMDRVSVVLGALMILLIAYVAILTNPPLLEVAHRSILPENYSVLGFSILTLVGGSIGGYITFAGGHRLLDSGINGVAHLKYKNR
ncbi:MAG: NRAMP family divalent metal transporter, partial [Bacteroidales bacterium]